VAGGGAGAGVGATTVTATEALLRSFATIVTVVEQPAALTLVTVKVAV